MTAPAYDRNGVTQTVQLPEWSGGLFEPHPYKVLWGGRGAARSWTVARALLLQGANHPLRVLCAREFQTSIRDSVHQLLTDQIALMGLRGYKVTDQEIRHECGTLFIFEGLRYNVAKVKSLEGVDICWVEEAERITKASWDVLIPTIRKEGAEIWITFNPDQETDETYKRFITNPPPGTWSKFATWRDNPFITTTLLAAKDHAYATDPDGAAWVWGGNCRKESAAQILRGKYQVREFTPFLHHGPGEACAELRAGKTCPHAWSGPYQGEDFGFADDPSAAVRLWVHDNVLYVEYEMWALHLEIDHTPGALEKAIPGFSRYTTRADSARPDSISYLRRHGVPKIVGVIKGKGSVEDGVAHLRSYTLIVIHPRCTHTVDEAKLYSYKVDERSGDILPDIVDKHNHCMDSIRYALEPMIKPRRKVGVMHPAPKPSGATTA